MKKSLVTRTSMVLIMTIVTMFAMLCVSYAADSNANKPTSSVSYLNEDDNSGLLNEQTKTFKDVSRSIVKFLVLIVDTVGVIALIILGISLVFGLGDPMNRQKLKSSMLYLFIALLIGNGAVFFVSWIIGIVSKIN